MSQIKTSLKRHFWASGVDGFLKKMPIVIIWYLNSSLMLNPHKLRVNEDIVEETLFTDEIYIPTPPGTDANVDGSETEIPVDPATTSIRKKGA